MKSLISLGISLIMANSSFAQTIELSAGQSAVLCAQAGRAIEAAAVLNSMLLKNKNQVSFESGSDTIIVASPYSTSAPSIAATDRASDYACVTLTKM